MKANNSSMMVNNKAVRLSNLNLPQENRDKLPMLT